MLRAGRGSAMRLSRTNRRWFAAGLLALLLRASLSAQAPVEPPAPEEPIRPPVLRPPSDLPQRPAAEPTGPFFLAPVDPPLGFSGPSGVMPRVGPGPSPDFIPREDRWRIGFPDWDRYQRGHPRGDDYPYMLGD